MKSVQFEACGHPAEVLHCVDSTPPIPGNGQIRVRMLASPINPSDLMFIQGTYGKQPKLPQIPGFEGVGVVESSGGGLKGRLFRGKRVAVLNAEGGNWAQQAVLPASQVIPLSRQLSIGQAATFFVNPATAWVMTQEVLRIPKGGWLLQTAAGSTLGQMIVRLGKALGFRTLNVVRSERHVDTLRGLGADRVVLFDGAKADLGELKASVESVVGPSGVSYAIDPVGGSTASAVVNCLAPSGRLLLYGTLCNQPLSFSPRSLMTQSASVEGFWLGSYMQTKNLLFKLKLIKRLTRLVLDGTLSSQISSTFDLDHITDAVTAAESGDRNGKVLLKIADS